MRIYKTRADFTKLDSSGNPGIFAGTVCTITDETANPMYVFQGGTWDSLVTATTDPVTGGIRKALASGRDLFADINAACRTFTAIGDSISSGCSDDAKLGWMAYAQCLAYHSLKLHRAAADNWAYAHSGWNTQQMLDAGFHTAAAESDADIVAVFAGANDAPTASTYLTTYNNILALAAPSIDAGKQVAIFSMLPRTGAQTDENKLYRAKIAAMLSEWCIANQIKFIDVFTESVDRSNGGFRSDATADQVHPSEAWHWWIAKKFVDAMCATSSYTFNAPHTGTITANAALQNYTGGLADGWYANACTPSSVSNAGSFSGSSQKIAPTGSEFAYLQIVGAGARQGVPVRATAIFEILSSQSVYSLHLGAVIYKTAGGSHAKYLGSMNSGIPLSPVKIPAGIYKLVIDITPEGDGNVLLQVGGQGDALIVHYAAAYEF